MDPQFALLPADMEMAEHQARCMVEKVVAGSMSPEAWMAWVAAQQWQQVEEHQWVLQHLADPTMQHAGSIGGSTGTNPQQL